jgi:hypothetical protein
MLRVQARRMQIRRELPIQPHRGTTNGQMRGRGREKKEQGRALDMKRTRKKSPIKSHTHTHCDFRQACKAKISIQWRVNPFPKANLICIILIVLNR